MSGVRSRKGVVFDFTRVFVIDVRQRLQQRPHLRIWAGSRRRSPLDRA
jgi:hypothetical protein